MQIVLARGMAAGLAALGISAVVAPKTASGVFGIPVDGPAALAWVRATGVRDLALGAIIAATLGNRAALRRVLLVSSFIGLADGLTVLERRGLCPQHAGHFGGFAAMLLTALSIDATSGEEPARDGASGEDD